MNHTRLKTHAKYRVIERRDVIQFQAITSDHLIEFTGTLTAKKCLVRLRHVDYHDEMIGKHDVFLTNHLSLVAKTIADFYKSRWQVELFF